MNESELLLRYRNTGDLQTLGDLYAPYMPLLYGVCYRYLQDEKQSEDAVMAIFEELIDKLRHHDVGNFKSWLYVYARNYCLMQLRQQKRYPHVDIQENLQESEQSLVQDDPKRWNEQDFSKLEVCMQTLNTEQETCVRLFYLQQMCYKDIATTTGYALSKVKSSIQNGKRNLKICMESKKNG